MQKTGRDGNPAGTGKCQPGYGRAGSGTAGGKKHAMEDSAVLFGYGRSSHTKGGGGAEPGTAHGESSPDSGGAVSGCGHVGIPDGLEPAPWNLEFFPFKPGAAASGQNSDKENGIGRMDTAVQGNSAADQRLKSAANRRVKCPE